MTLITGNVLRGDGIAGKRYGVPTANIGLIDAADLGFGTYAGYATWGDKRYEAMIYYGANDPKKLEVHLFNFIGDMYGTRLSVDPRLKVSEYVPWTTEEAMKKKIADDISRTRAFFASQKHIA